MPTRAGLSAKLRRVRREKTETARGAGTGGQKKDRWKGLFSDFDELPEVGGYYSSL